MTTKQESAWAGEFGKEYTERNPHSADEMNLLYKKEFGVTRSEMNSSFLDGIDRKTTILEVGSNVGAQLQLLQRDLEFDSLAGIELREDAVKFAMALTDDINYWCGSGVDLPFMCGRFGLVFTTRVLIHINPDDLIKVMREIYRCSSQYIWGFEYYAEEPTSVRYRGQDDLLWKRDFAQLYLDYFHLRLVKKELIPHIDDDNVDCMFLLEKY